MNQYINKILQQTDNLSKDKKVQYTINYLIDKYANEDLGYSKGQIYLTSIQEIANYFPEQKINYSRKDDLLLRITSLLGEKDFIEWLLKKANCKIVPNLNVERGSPLRLAITNQHTDLIDFYLTDKQIKRSFINELNGAPLSMALEQKNISIIELFLAQPEIEIQIEHIEKLYRLELVKQRKILSFISKNPLKTQFFDKMLQYRHKMEGEIKDLITSNYFEMDVSMKEKIQAYQQFEGMLEKKEFLDKLDNKLPAKNGNVKQIKI